MTDPKGVASRRDFIKASSAVAALSSIAVPSVHAAGSDVIKVGLVGCGGRGRGAAEQSVTSSSNVKLVAMGDTFRDHLDSARDSLRKLSDRVDVPDDRCFVGFDAYQKVIASGVDLVILATPPGFRPIHLAAAVEAGKHVFTEKPVAVDGPGIRAVLEIAEKAKAKNLAIVAGTQRRHQQRYLEAMKSIHDGAIGDLLGARCYWNQGSLWNKPRQDSWSDTEWQLRNWLYFTWLSGDHIVEQHVHNLDVINWAMNAHPTKAVGMGGREVRSSKDFGHIFDHFAIEYTYPNGATLASYARQIPGCENNVSEFVQGTKGSFNSLGSFGIKGENNWRFRGEERNPYEQEHIDLVESIRAGKPLNELKTVAESTLTAIMGRMSAYTGKTITWEEALNSKQALVPTELAFGPMPVPAVAVPGQTPFV